MTIKRRSRQMRERERERARCGFGQTVVSVRRVCSRRALVLVCVSLATALACWCKLRRAAAASKRASEVSQRRVREAVKAPPETAKAAQQNTARDLFLPTD